MTYKDLFYLSEEDFLRNVHGFLRFSWKLRSHNAQPCMSGPERFFPVESLFMAMKREEEATLTPFCFHRGEDFQLPFTIYFFPQWTDCPSFFLLADNAEELFFSSLHRQCQMIFHGFCLTENRFHPHQGFPSMLGFKGIFQNAQDNPYEHSWEEISSLFHQNCLAVTTEFDVLELWKEEARLHFAPLQQQTQVESDYPTDEEEWEDYEEDSISPQTPPLSPQGNEVGEPQATEVAPDPPAPPITLDVSLPQNKKAQSIHDIVKGSFLQLDIKVIRTQFFMQYQMEEGYYKEQSTVLPDVMGALGDNREKLNSADFKNLEQAYGEKTEYFRGNSR